MKLILLTGLYFLSGQVGWLFPDVYYTITPLWLPGGVGLVILYFLGYRYFPAVWLGLYFLNSVHGGLGQGFALITCTGTTLATLTAAILLRNRDFHPALNRVRDLFPLAFSIVILASLSALAGALAVFNFTDSDELEFFQVFSTWWVGEVIGGVIVGSLGFVWAKGNPGFGRQRRLELAALVVGVIGISVLCFYNDNTDWIERFQLSFVVFPSLVWASLRFGPHGTTLVTLLIAVIALLGTVQGFGLFSFADASQNLFLLQSYLAVICMTGLVLSSASTEQSENEEALRSANESLEKSIRSFSHTAREARKANQKKSEFLALMSHELRNPLNGVVGFTSLLMNTDLTRAQRDHIGMIHSSGETLLGMIDEILDFNRIETNRPELNESPFSMRRLIGEVADTFRFHSDRKSVALEVDYPEEVCDFVVGDHQRIRQILNNLVGNAVKFTEEGSVTIRVIGETGTDEESFRLRISIVDTGIGIEKEEAERLFAPFSQANQTIAGRFGGTGLGLVIAKNLSDALGGTITLESEPGKGTSFYFSIPLAYSAEEEVVDEEAKEHLHHPASRFPSLDPQRVLIAEDNSTNQRVVQQLLERLGHESVVARDGREALDILKNGEFDLLLLDIRMPGIDGYAVARAVREGKCGLEKRSLPIIAVTAHAMAEDKEKTRNAGMNGHLTKPFDLEKLANALADAIGKPEEKAKTA